MMRVTGTMLAVVLFALLIPEAVADEKYCPLDQEIQSWQLCLSKPHHAGDDAHNEFLLGLEKALQSVPGVKVESQVRTFTRWDPVEPTLVGGGLSLEPEQIWPLPYSGLTGEKGVTANLYYERCVGLGWHFDAKKHAGKIVVMKFKPTLLLNLYLTGSTKRAIPWWRHLFPGKYRRAIAFERQIPSLREAQLMGVLGVIVVFDGDPKISQDQYVPFTRALHEVPAVYVDRKLEDQLIRLAKKGQQVTLTHYGSLYPEAATRHLLVTLPATLPATPEDKCERKYGAIVLTTHTDGPNWFEDNGPFALWRLLNSFAKEDCRPRDLVFVFAAAHLAHEPGSNDDVVRRNPTVFARARAAVAIEHLGAQRYTDKEKKKKIPEPMLVLTTEHDKVLNHLATQVVKAHKLVRPVHIFFPGNLKYGEGVHPEAAEIPTIAFLSNPAYLLQEHKNWHKEWFSSELMDHQIEMLRDLVKRMMSMKPPRPPHL